MSGRNTGNNLGLTEVVGPNLDTGVEISGQITVVTAGVAVQGPDVPLINGVWIESHPSNTDLVAYGNNGRNNISMLDGFVLSVDKLHLAMVANLNELWFNAAVGNSKFCWMKA